MVPRIWVFFVMVVMVVVMMAVVMVVVVLVVEADDGSQSQRIATAIGDQLPIRAIHVLTTRRSCIQHPKFVIFIHGIILENHMI